MANVGELNTVCLDSFRRKACDATHQSGIEKNDFVSNKIPPSFPKEVLLETTHPQG